MAGHSKWANVKHRKARQDAKRGKFFTKALREITVAVKQGGAGEDNPRLRQAKEKALTLNVPGKTIERAIARALGGEGGENYSEVVYEGYGPGGVAIYIETLTDNKNRTVAEIRHILGRFGGNLGREGCVAHLFKREGLIELAGVADEGQLLEDATNAGAEDMQSGENGIFYLQTAADNLVAVKEALRDKKYEISYADITMSPLDVCLLSTDKHEKLQSLLEYLEDLDDVRSVYSNAQEAAVSDSGA